MKIAYFDCFSGISGDMILGALVDAGVEADQLKTTLADLPISGYDLEMQKASRKGLRGTRVRVRTQAQEVERHLHEIEGIIENSGLSESIKDRSVAIFRRLGEAEAKVHGIPVEHVHFHEVGAVDAIVDVVGSVAGLAMLGVEKVYASPVHIGRGTVTCAHGTLPVPAPATQELLKGVPVYGRDVNSELVTPTGAAILTTLVAEFGHTPPMSVASTGYGAGARDLPLPNFLRISIGPALEEPTGYDEDRVVVIETNVDDMNPQWHEHVMSKLFDAGALDVFLTPIQMKRGRPAVRLSTIAGEDRTTDILAVLFAETTTIGVRSYPVRRWKLPREHVTVDTSYGAVSVKAARLNGSVINLAPEYRECQRAAQEHGVPLKQVYGAAIKAAQEGLEESLADD